MVNACVDAIMGNGCVSHVVQYHGVSLYSHAKFSLHRFLSRLFALRICGAAFPVLWGGVGWDWSRTIWRIVFLGSTEVFGEGEGTTRISTIPRGESLS